MMSIEAIRKLAKEARKKEGRDVQSQLKDLIQAVLGLADRVEALEKSSKQK